MFNIMNYGGWSICLVLSIIAFVTALYGMIKTYPVKWTIVAFFDIPFLFLILFVIYFIIKTIIEIYKFNNKKMKIS